MTERCFICRQPVDGLYRREMPVARNTGWAYGTELMHVSSVTYAPVSLCRRCDAAEAERIRRREEPGKVAIVITAVVMLLVGLSFMSSIIGLLAGSETVARVTLVVLWSGVVLWTVARWLSRWFTQKEVSDETPRLYLRDRK